METVTVKQENYRGRRRKEVAARKKQERMDTAWLDDLKRELLTGQGDAEALKGKIKIWANNFFSSVEEEGDEEVKRTRIRMFVDAIDAFTFDWGPERENFDVYGVPKQIESAAWALQETLIRSVGALSEHMDSEVTAWMDKKLCRLHEEYFGEDRPQKITLNYLEITWQIDNVLSNDFQCVRNSLDPVMSAYVRAMGRAPDAFSALREVSKWPVNPEDILLSDPAELDNNDAEHVAEWELHPEDSESNEGGWYFSSPLEGIRPFSPERAPGALYDTRLALFEARYKDVDPKQIIDDLIRWAREERLAFLFRKEIAAIMNKADAEHAKLILLDLLSKTDGREWKELIISILRRLELGVIPIDEDGLEYLGNAYDVGQYNAPQNVARRLTTDGKLGIFDAGRSMACYFQSELPGQGQRFEPKLGHLTVEELFFPDPNASDDERQIRDRQREIFVKDYFGFVQSEIFEETGVYLADFSFREQMGLVRLYPTLSQEDKNEAMHLLRSQGAHGLRAFLALDFMHSDPQILFTIQDRFNVDASLVFRDFSAVIERAQRFYDQLAPSLEKKLGKSFDGESWMRKWLEKGAGLFQKANAVAERHTGRAGLNADAEAGLYKWGEADDYWVTYAELQDTLKQEAPYLKGKNCHEYVTQQVAADLANTFSAEEVRALLYEIDSDLAGDLAKYLQPETPGSVKEDLQELYEL